MSVGSPHALRRKEDVIAGLLRLQAPEGGFFTFDWPVANYNPITPSNTSRTIQALLALGVSPQHACLRRALEWLLKTQQPDGSWFDFWWMDPIYPTWLALEALVRAGVREIGHPDVERGLHLVLRTQNSDGGWGFDWQGHRLPHSRVEHTAWAVSALCSLGRKNARPMSAIQRGVRFLVQNQTAGGDWPAAYVSQWDGMEGYANTQYTMLFALRALGAYRKVLQAHLVTAPQLVRHLRVAERKAERG
jgi:squalene cyclase